MNNNQYISESLKIGTICIDSYEEKSMTGRLWYPSFGSEQKFENLMQLIEDIDNSLRDLGFPNEYSKTRSFDRQDGVSTSKAGSRGDFSPEDGKIATFRIKIIFLQNATWQGIITWVDKDQEENFRSMREMIYLMDSALKSSSNGN